MADKVALRLFAFVFLPCRPSTDSLSPTQSTSAHLSSARRETAAGDRTQCEYLPPPVSIHPAGLKLYISCVCCWGDFFCSHLKPSVTGLAVLCSLTAVRMKDLLPSPSPKRLRPVEPALLFHLLNHAGLLLCVLQRQSEHSMVLLHIMFIPPSLDSTVPVGVWCSVQPTPGSLQEFSSGNRNSLALDIIVAPLCYKEDTLLRSLILRRPFANGTQRKVNITVNIDALLTWKCQFSALYLMSSFAILVS